MFFLLLFCFAKGQAQVTAIKAGKLVDREKPASAMPPKPELLG
jgi:hypothetical protein